LEPNAENNPPIDEEAAGTHTGYKCITGSSRIHNKSLLLISLTAVLSNSSLAAIAHAPERKKILIAQLTRVSFCT